MAREDRWFNGRLLPTPPGGGGDNNGDFGDPNIPLFGFSLPVFGFQSPGSGGRVQEEFSVTHKELDFSHLTVEEKTAGTLRRMQGFGSISLCCLLEGVKACCKGEFAKRYLKNWEDGGRKFKLECRENEADRFLLCSVVDLEANKYCLAFSEGKDILGGWTLLAEKLCSFGVSTCDEPNEVLVFFRTESRVGAYEGKTKNSYVEAVKPRARKLGEAVWLQLGKKYVLSGTMVGGATKGVRSDFDDQKWVGKEQEVRDEEGVVSHAGYNVEQVQFHEQSAKVVMLLDCGGPNEDFLGFQLESSPPVLNLTEFTDEALMEASRYTVSYHRALLSLGKWDFSSSLLFLDTDVLKRVFKEVLEERNEVGEPCWQSSFLAKFNRCLGISVEGFEEEILFLLKRMKKRKTQNGKLDGRKKKKLESSKFEKELRKLEWTVNYLGSGGEKGRDGVVFASLNEDLFAFLECVKSKLKEWNKDVFGKIEYMKNLALDQMEFVDDKEKTNRLSLEEMEARRETMEEYKKWILLEENTWRQKSKKVWLKEGDRNTGFFHKMANAHRRRNNCETLENMDACALEVPFTEEVYDALLGCSKDKASRTDGFSMAFWQFAWDFVKNDVMNFFSEFYEHSKFFKSLNATFMVLANRPKKVVGKVVGKVVSKAQGAFVEGRQILVAMLIANEAIDLVLKNNENGILCKLDIEKAYDNVEWVKSRSEEGVEISHLLFADDTLVFCQAFQDHLTYLSWLLMWFEAMSGLRINLEKSELIPVWRVENIDDLALDFGCRVGNLSSTYLGLLLGAPFKSVSMWDGVEERFRRRLAMWKKQYLSKGRRATLIQSTL
ncbi:hypothetical protein CK203_043831 [Vitis vinifera]|uniref:Reverse transcriptase domain-containing protein n=1 Tax=Vitis vinifera TaxID=29760 RepID=A0A438HVJ8_VITVI|nr:hypothetical protein CK203_043831 [Vitis vinifera]